jgi:hypothetical protein
VVSHENTNIFGIFCYNKSMNLDHQFLKAQINNIQREKELAQAALKKIQITESEQFEIDNTLWKKLQEPLRDFSPEDQKHIEKYFILNNKIKLLEKEVQNKIEKNLDEGMYNLKINEMDKLQKQKNELHEHFKINPHLSDYLSSFDQINPELN